MMMPTLSRAHAARVLFCAMLIGPGSVTAQGQAPPAQNGKLYTVVDGYKVDPNTMKGFRAWRAAACDRCHGANQEGLVGPSLLDQHEDAQQGRVRQDRARRPARQGHAELRQQQDR